MGSMYGCVAIWKFVGDYASSAEPINDEAVQSSTNIKQVSRTLCLSQKRHAMHVLYCHKQLLQGLQHCSIAATPYSIG